MNLRESIIQQKQRGRVPVIAEVKRRIPKLGSREYDQRDAGELACYYETGGAAGISVVAETRHFGGDPERDIPAVLEAVSLPVLIKDFILNTMAIDYYARLIEAVNAAYLNRMALLLITHLAGDRTVKLIEHIHRYGMLALVETRGVEDLQYITGAELPPTLIGINNKVIDRLETDANQVGLTNKVIRRYREVAGTALIISESAHSSPADVEISMGAGADAVLVGTAFMLARDPAAKVAEFVQAGKVK